MNCDKCGKTLDFKWRFCPYCGQRVRFRLSINLSGLFKQVSEMFSPQKGSQSVQKQKMVSHSFKKSVEPKSKTFRRGAFLTHEISVPGVKSMKNVEVRILKESVEIRAYAKDTLYFKVFNEKRGELVDKTLKKETLILTFS